LNAVAANPQDDPFRIALVGNPNCGKTALFNRLTGSRQKVANYAGVTVERKEGRFVTPGGRHVQVLDLPGAYSLVATSPDEEITRDLCLGKFASEESPELMVCVVDATNLRLHLRFVLELRRLWQPMVVALNMIDVARRRGIVVDRAALEAQLGMPVIETVAVRRDGAKALLTALDATARTPNSLLPVTTGRRWSDGPDEGQLFDAPDSDESLHGTVRDILRAAVRTPVDAQAIDDRIDRVVLHPALGLAILAVLLFLMFQAVFAWATPLMEGIETLIGALGSAVAGALPEGVLRSLLVDGIIAGLGSVLVFLPQILILFLFILALEESGYLPRAAFLLDRLMVGAGLSGRSFIPLLSSFACAIPGIMAARTIGDPRDRLVTILVAPLMTCSARLPVYALLIGAFIPQRTVWGVFNLQGVTLFGLYVAGIVSALGVAYAMKWLRRDRTREHALMMELPSYRVPHLRDLAIGLYERGMIFLKRVGGVILVLTVLLWALSSFPAPPEGVTGAPIHYSFAGQLGRALQHVFAPIGFNWEISIALVPGMAAREVAVGALATVYSLSATDADAALHLAPVIAAQWSMATAFSLLAWFVFAPQCLSTLATIKRETNSWGVTLGATAYLFALAYIASFFTYRVALALT